MPYIKKSLRGSFDNAVVLAIAETGRISTAQSSTVKLIIQLMKNIEIENFDGCLNYVFSQMLRKVTNLWWTGDIILGVIDEIFLKEPRYWKLERALGLIDAMEAEFKRRRWRPLDLVEILLTLMRIREVILHNIDIYEDKKIAENGDLE